MADTILKYWPIISVFMVYLFGLTVFFIRQDGKIKFLMAENKKFNNFIVGVDDKLEALGKDTAILLDRDQRGWKHDS